MGYGILELNLTYARINFAYIIMNMNDKVL